jgi:hypothetical protein
VARRPPALSMGAAAGAATDADGSNYCQLYDTGAVRQIASHHFIRTTGALALRRSAAGGAA